MAGYRDVMHLSDCAVHNAPALPVGPCDCGAAVFEALLEQAGYCIVPISSVSKEEGENCGD
jgi:hypothetical protein